MLTQNLQIVPKIAQLQGLMSDTDGIELHIVWRGTPNYLEDCLLETIESANFKLSSISKEERADCANSDGSMQNRPVRRVRLIFTGSEDNFYPCLLMVLHEVDRIAPWVQMSRLSKHSNGFRPRVVHGTMCSSAAWNTSHEAKQFNRTTCLGQSGKI